MEPDIGNLSGRNVYVDLHMNVYVYMDVYVNVSG